jgi:HPr kinase/phosphorylase
MSGAAAELHASCVARDGAALLLLGASGSGKSDLALRLLGRGFVLVADDRAVIQNGIVRPAPRLAGLLEVRGLGILCLPHLPEARLALVAHLATPERLPAPLRHPEFDVPELRVAPFAASAPDFLIFALDCALGRIGQIAGAFAP